MHFFLDSSALVKYYTIEQGTNWIRTRIARYSGNSIFVSQITSVEVMSAIYRQRREGTLSSTRASRTRQLLDGHFANRFQLVGLHPQVIRRAKGLLDTHRLRAYDAIQLSSAIVTNASLMVALNVRLTFVSADVRLLNVATLEGLTIDDPNQYP